MTAFTFFVIFGVRGWISFYQYAAIVSKDRKAKDWPSVLGTITSSSLKKERRATIRQGNHTERYDLFTPQIKYTYTVKGNIHESSHIGYGIYTRRSDTFGKKLMERFPQGASVSVYYNPADPRVSLLEKRATHTYGMYIYSILFMLASVIFFGIWLYQLFT
ncbi:MAG: DUF3592 domain-containing protein [Anaerolineales bacterium]